MLLLRLINLVNLFLFFFICIILVGGTALAQINRVHGAFPSVPYLSQYEDLPEVCVYYLPSVDCFAMNGLVGYQFACVNKLCFVRDGDTNLSSLNQ